MKKGQRQIIDVTPTVAPGETLPAKPDKPGRMRTYEFPISFDYLAKEIFGTKQTGPAARGRFIDLLRNCGDDEIRKVVTLWDSTPPSRRSKLLIEDLCQRANVECRWLVEKAAGLMFDLGGDVSKMIVAISQPEVIRKTVQQALKADGHKDRKLFLQGSGFVPAPVNQFGLMVNNQLPGPGQPPAHGPAPITNVLSIEEQNMAEDQFGE